MTDNVDVTPGTGKTVLADEVTDATLGTGIAQFAKIMDGTLNGTNKLAVDSHGNIGIVNRDSTGAEIVAGTQNPVAVTPRANANGATSSRIVSVVTSPAPGANLKASAGNLMNIDLFNNAAYDVFVKFYNKATGPTVGTDTPVWTIPIKAGTGFSREFVQGKSFATGIGYAITKLIGDSDTTAVAAGDVTGSIDWI